MTLPLGQKNVLSQLGLPVNLGTSGGNFSDNEVPAGTKNGVNKVFTLAHAPSPAASLELSFNGMGPLQAAGVDFTLVGLTITMVTIAPDTGATPPDILLANYRYA